MASALAGPAGCRDEPASPADEAARDVDAPGDPEAVTEDPLSLADVSAFDLRVDAEGAFLVYAARGALFYQRLGRAGGAEREPQRVVELSGRVHALVAGASAGRVALAWLRTESTRVHVERAVGVGRRPTFGPPATLEEWAHEGDEGGELGARELALRTTSTGEFRLLHRATPIPCEASARCATYRESGLAEAPTLQRASPALAAPVACPWALPGVVEASGRIYYGLCVLLEGAPRTTLYLLQPEPQYAQAEAALAGCRPLGVLAASEPPGAREPSSALFAADCPSGREVVRLGQPGVSAAPVGPVLAPACSAQGPTLHVGAAAVPLSAPRDRLEGFLPSALDPAGSRVVFSGDVFLVAELIGSTLSVRALPCRE